jgi:hypothetical protein
MWGRGGEGEGDEDGLLHHSVRVDEEERSRWGFEARRGRGGCDGMQGADEDIGECIIHPEREDGETLSVGTVPPGGMGDRHRRDVAPPHTNGTMVWCMTVRVQFRRALREYQLRCGGSGGARADEVAAAWVGHR